ncbi:hypothetical protein OKJ48_42445 [Streptomyces kunmingensis]|uniref:Lipoprotein n=1 Tax=Streptomyces kunmingensis TaxID=68225 RepID=A0ABU6CQ27_9ACTN|nr:hypothetical protein [Streptomyces kunmingensis]MEB3966849.1 hypothetical protein [Streptomyces kunmingensis]
MRQGRGDRPAAVRRTRRSLRRAALMPAVLAATLAGCGVQPSEVVEVGEPAKGMSPATAVYFLVRDTEVSRPPQAAPTPGVPASGVPDPEGDSEPPANSGGASAPGGNGKPAPDGVDEPSTTGPGAAGTSGDLHAAPRPAAPSGTDPVTYAVRQLLAGPTAAESDGLTTALPELEHPSRVTTEVTTEKGSGTDTFLVRFPVGTARPTGPALRQLACTAARTHHAQRNKDSADREGAARTTSVPATGAMPAEHDPVRVQVTDRQPGKGQEPRDSWEITVTDNGCPG